MCRTIVNIFQSIGCLMQLFVRIFMTIVLMAENLIRMILQSIYNLLSVLFQLLSLIPICCVFLVTSKIKCALCGGGGGCAGARGGNCDYFMSIVALVILFFIFRATGVIDKVFYKLGYSKTESEKYLSDTVTLCSTNETDYQLYDYDGETTTNKIKNLRKNKTNELDTDVLDLKPYEQAEKQQSYALVSNTTTLMSNKTTKIELIESTDLISTMTTNAPSIAPSIGPTETIQILKKGLTQVEYLEVYNTTQQDQLIVLSPKSWGPGSSSSDWTTVLYYLVA